MAALTLIQLIGSAIIVIIVVPAGRWLEYFASRDMEEIAVIGAMVIVIGGLVGAILGINRIVLWRRLRKIKRSRSLLHC